MYRAIARKTFHSAYHMLCPSAARTVFVLLMMFFYQ